MKNMLNSFLHRISTAQNKYINEQITSEEKQKKIETAIKMFEVNIEDESKKNRTFIIEKMSNVLTKPELHELKSLLYEYNITK